MKEIHPFKPYVPENCQILIIGSFPGKDSTQQHKEGDWYYGAKRNQFWTIIEKVYGITLSTKQQKTDLFSRLQIGLTDVILSCVRKENKNTDNNLINRTYNIETVLNILDNYPIKKILFTGKGVYDVFKKKFKYKGDAELITLPSPSPIYRKITIEEKTEVYKKYFPILESNHGL